MRFLIVFLLAPIAFATGCNTAFRENREAGASREQAAPGIEAAKTEVERDSQAGSASKGGIPAFSLGGGGGGGGRNTPYPMARYRQARDEDSSGPPVVSDAEHATLFHALAQSNEFRSQI